MLLGRRGRAYAELGRGHEAIADASKAIALRPEQDQLWKLQRLWLLRADAQAELGLWDQAAADLTRAVEQDAGDPLPQFDLAHAHLAGGDIDGYRRACTRLLRDFGRRNYPHLANAVAWTCILAPEAVADREAVVRWAWVAVKAASKNSQKHAVLNTLGAATYRAGRFEEAIGHLNEAMKALPEPGGLRSQVDGPARGKGSSGPAAGGNAFDWLFLAMAHHRLGHAVEARQWLDKAVAAIDRATQAPPDGSSSGSRINWKTRLSYRVLRREAEGQIGGAGSGRPKSDGGEKSGQ
jgi:tetratricopeptide (TPR) repeat protein